MRDPVAVLVEQGGLRRRPSRAGRGVTAQRRVLEAAGRTGDGADPSEWLGLVATHAIASKPMRSPSVEEDMSVDRGGLVVQDAMIVGGDDRQPGSLLMCSSVPSRPSLAFPSLQCVTAMRSPSGAIEIHIGRPRPARSRLPARRSADRRPGSVRPSITAMSRAPSGRAKSGRRPSIGFPTCSPVSASMMRNTSSAADRAKSRRSRSQPTCRSPARRTDRSPHRSRVSTTATPSRICCWDPSGPPAVSGQDRRSPRRSTARRPSGRER